MSKSKKLVYQEGITKKHEVLKEAMKYLSPISLDVPTKKSKQFEFVCQCINKTITGDALDFSDKSGLIKEIEERLIRRPKRQSRTQTSVHKVVLDAKHVRRIPC